MLTLTDSTLLQKTELFYDLQPDALGRALRFFDAREQSFAKGETLKNPLEKMPAFGLVLEGSVSVAMNSIDGREMLLSLVTKGQTFGEAICYLEEISPIRITAEEHTRLMWLRCDNLKNPGCEGDCSRFCARFTAMLCKRTLRMNDRIQILSRGSIREKLNAFFTECARDVGKNTFTVPFDRRGMAAYLGVDRSALSRALSQMQSEGLIRYHKSRFELLK